MRRREFVGLLGGDLAICRARAAGGKNSDHRISRRQQRFSAEQLDVGIPQAVYRSFEAFCGVDVARNYSAKFLKAVPGRK
jgi:hypothetical protein